MPQPSDSNLRVECLSGRFPISMPAVRPETVRAESAHLRIAFESAHCGLRQAVPQQQGVRVKPQQHIELNILDRVTICHSQIKIQATENIMPNRWQNY